MRWNVIETEDGTYRVVDRKIRRVVAKIDTFEPFSEKAKRIAEFICESLEKQEEEG